MEEAACGRGKKIRVSPQFWRTMKTGTCTWCGGVSRMQLPLLRVSGPVGVLKITTITIPKRQLTGCHHPSHPSIILRSTDGLPRPSAAMTAVRGKQTHAHALGMQPPPVYQQKAHISPFGAGGTEPRRLRGTPPRHRWGCCRECRTGSQTNEQHIWVASAYPKNVYTNIGLTLSQQLVWCVVELAQTTRALERQRPMGHSRTSNLGDYRCLAQA